MAGKVNTLIFPNLAAGNIAYKLIQEMGGFEVVGPVLLGCASRSTFFKWVQVCVKS